MTAAPIVSRAPRRPVLRGEICALAWLVLTGCDLQAVAPLTPSLWEASLSSATLTGRAAAISRQTGTEASIQVHGLAPSATLGWRIRASSCGNPGAVFGSPDDYPVLVEASGSASAETFVVRRLVEGAAYHVAILTMEPASAPVACGVLVPR